MARFYGKVNYVTAHEKGDIINYYDENLGAFRPGFTAYHGCRLQNGDLIQIDKSKSRGTVLAIWCLQACLTCEGFIKSRQEGCKLVRR